MLAGFLCPLDNSKVNLDSAIDVLRHANEWIFFPTDPNVKELPPGWADSAIRVLEAAGKTGLKDKNGKEIYEGDIVHVWSEYNTDPKDGTNTHDYGNWEIYWRIDRWHLRRGERLFDNGDYYQGDEVPWNEEKGVSKMEVVGNIYESPELLAGE